MTSTLPGSLALTVFFLLTPGCGPDAPDAEAPLDAAALAEQVRQEYLHAWTGYTTYAWGHDDLKPLSKTYHDWYDEPLLMSAVDALDGLILLGFDDEADRTRDYIAANLSFDKDISVKTFEITIRLLGSLLACYQLTDDARLLALADDLGTRLLPAFDSPTGLPYTFVNLRTGDVRQPNTNPAEVGTLILEFGTLSRLTGNPVYYDRAKAALTAVYERRSDLGLVGQGIDVETGAWTDSLSHIGGRIDSYFEYLLKGWLLFDDEDLKAMYDTHVAALNEHLAMETASGFWYGRVDMATGSRVAPHFGALDAFFPAVLTLSGDLDRAERLQASAFAMWTLHGLEPEMLDFETMEVVDGLAMYHLRPEIIESAYYLYHYTGDPQYRAMGQTIFNDLRRYCRTDAGYAAIADVRTKEQMDAMESFLFGETLKYLYLLFTDDPPFDLDDVILTTEAHPLVREGGRAKREEG